jgi:enoyl-CoA hydratase/carnithine racemase
MSTAGLKESYEHILVDATTHPGVGVITLHRPKALNALCDGLFADLIHAATALDQNNDDIGCIVLTGSTKAFAAGADISEMKDRTFDYAYTKVGLCTCQRLETNLILQHLTMILLFLYILDSYFIVFRICIWNGLT